VEQCGGRGAEAARTTRDDGDGSVEFRHLFS
jgi:hypothetical protein